MSYANNHISGLLMYAMAFSFLMVPLTWGDELLRYSQNDPRIKVLIEGVKGTPGGYGVRVAENIVGTWKPLRKEAKTCTKFLEDTNVTWCSLQFTNGLVEISYELAKEGEVRQFIGRYQVIHKATEGFGNAPNIVIRSQNTNDENLAVLVGVKIGEFNCFPGDLTILWFYDPDGHNYFFEPVGISREEMRKRLGYISAEEQGRNKKKAMEDRKLKNRRIADPKMTKRVIDDLKNGKLTEEDQNHKILDLMNKGDETAVPILLEHMKDGRSLVIRQNAIRALGKIGDKAAVPALLAFLNTPVEGNINDDEAEDNAILRRNAVIALRDIGDPKALPTLNNIMVASREYQTVRDLAKNAIRKIENPKQP